jgi:hypothetical protein
MVTHRNHNSLSAFHFPLSLVTVGLLRFINLSSGWNDSTTHPGIVLIATRSRTLPCCRLARRHLPGLFLRSFKCVAQSIKFFFPQQQILQWRLAAHNHTYWKLNSGVVFVNSHWVHSREHASQHAMTGRDLYVAYVHMQEKTNGVWPLIFSNGSKQQESRPSTLETCLCTVIC